MIRADGWMTEGECFNGKLQGQVVETGPNCDRQEGEYVNWKQHGLWLRTLPNGTRLEQQFVNGRMVSEKVSPSPNPF